MKREAIVGGVLVLLVLAVFWPAAGYDSADYDDADYVFANPYVLQGITWRSLSWAFTTVHRNYWLPLTWLSYMVDSDVQGTGPSGYHRTNVILHAANALLLFLVLRRMTGSLWASAWVAAAFAVHPLRMENVAWIADRKDLLSTFFGLLALGAYARHAAAPSRKRMLTVAVFLLLALMAKQMLVTFPFVLLLLDWWPLGRTEGRKDPASPPTHGASGLRRASGKTEEGPPSWRAARHFGEPGKDGSWRRLVVEKLPLFAVCLLVGILTWVLHRWGGTGGDCLAPPLAHRLLRVLLNYVAYLAKTFWPAKLSVVYPMAALPSLWKSILAGAFLLAVTAAVVWFGRRRRYLAVGWLWFGITLAPVIGLVQVGTTDIADRFMYVPQIGLFILLGWGVADLLARQRGRRSALGVLAAVSLLALVLATRAQLPHWRNAETLSRRALSVTRNNFVAWNSLGRALEMEGRLADAAYCYARAVTISPAFVQARINLGIVLGRMGRFEEAIQQLRLCLKLDPTSPTLRANLGTILFSAGSRREALEHLREAVRLNPRDASAQYNLGWGLLQMGRGAEALPSFVEAARINPADHAARFYAGVLYAEARDFRRARRLLGAAIKLKPDNERYHKALEALPGE